MSNMAYPELSKNLSPLTYTIQGTNINNYSNLNQNNIQLQSIQPQIFQQQTLNPISNIGMTSVIQPNIQTINPQYTQIIGNSNIGSNQLNISNDQILNQGLQTNLYSINPSYNQITVDQNSGLQVINPQNVNLLNQQITGNAQLYSSQLPLVSQTLQNNLISNNQNLNQILIGQNANSIQTINTNPTYTTTLDQQGLINNHIYSTDGQLISQPISTNIVSMGINSNSLIQGQNLGISNVIQPTSIQSYNDIFPNSANQKSYTNQTLNSNAIPSTSFNINQPIQTNLYDTLIPYPQIINQNSIVPSSFQVENPAINQINSQNAFQTTQTQSSIPSSFQTINLTYPQIIGQNSTNQTSIPISIQTLNQNVGQEYNLSALNNQIPISQQNIIQGNIIPSSVNLQPITGQSTSIANTTGEGPINIVISPPKIDSGFNFMGPNPAMFEYFNSYQAPQYAQEGNLPPQNQFEENNKPQPQQEPNQMIPNSFELSFKGPNYPSNPLYQARPDKSKEENELKDNQNDSKLDKDGTNEEKKESNKNDEDEDSGFFASSNH